MAGCGTLLTKSKLANGCPQTAGIFHEFYIGNIEDIESYTLNATTKVIETLVMKTGKMLYKFVGKAKANTAGSEGEVSDNGNTFRQRVTIVADYVTQADMEALEELCKASQLFVINLSNRKQYLAFGLPKDPDNIDVLSGLKQESSQFPLGTVAGDLTAATIVLGGSLENIPVIFEAAGASLATTKAYLEAALVAAA